MITLNEYSSSLLPAGTMCTLPQLLSPRMSSFNANDQNPNLLARYVTLDGKTKLVLTAEGKISDGYRALLSVNEDINREWDGENSIKQYEENQSTWRNMHNNELALGGEMLFWSDRAGEGVRNL